MDDRGERCEVPVGVDKKAARDPSEILRHADDEQQVDEFTAEGPRDHASDFQGSVSLSALTRNRLCVGRPG